MRRKGKPRIPALGKGQVPESSRVDISRGTLVPDQIVPHAEQQIDSSAGYTREAVRILAPRPGAQGTAFHRPERRRQHPRGQSGTLPRCQRTLSDQFPDGGGDRLQPDRGGGNHTKGRQGNAARGTATQEQGGKDDPEQLPYDPEDQVIP